MKKWGCGYFMSKEMELVMEYEKRQGRNPEDVSRRYVGYDIKSNDRLIVVKKRDIKYGFLYITKNEFTTFLENKNAYLYLVYYRDEKPKLKILHRDIILANSKISIKYQLRLRKKVMESANEINLV